MIRKIFIPPALEPFEIIMFVLYARLLTTRRMIFGGLQGFRANAGEGCLKTTLAATPVGTVFDTLFPAAKPAIGRADAGAGRGRNIPSGI